MELFMYGMVNNAIKNYISLVHGDDTWAKVFESTDIEHDNFISMEQYEDSDSVALIVSAANITESTPEKLLEEVGEYWIQFALDSHYGNLLLNAGNTLPEVLMNLDNLHVRVGYSFTDLKPPSFWCSEVSDHELTLHYSSERDGLSPMVTGLVKGLAKMLDITCTVEPLETQQGVDHHQFRVTF